MPSPFPGMDPYLEGEMWQEFHETLAGAIRAQIMPLVRPKYVALLARRYVVDRPALGILDLPPEQRIIYPDASVVKSTETAAEPPLPTPSEPAATAPTVELPSLVEEEVPLLSIEIRDIARRRLVTIVEILSPVNKRGDGAREYIERRVELMKTDTHLLEIDLLRRGQRLQFQGQPPSAAYYIYLSRFQRRPYTQIWPVSLRSPLPTVPVPLLPPDPDVVLDLQAAVDACFELVEYERLIDYRVPPPPPELSAEDAAWLNQVLQTAGIDQRSA